MRARRVIWCADGGERSLKRRRPHLNRAQRVAYRKAIAEWQPILKELGGALKISVFIAESYLG